MLRNFVKLTASYSLINVFQKLADYLAVIFFVSAFSTDQYGIVSTNTMIILGLTSICSLSLEGAVARYYFKYQNKGGLAEYIGCILSYTIIFALCLGVLFALFSQPLWAWAFKDLPFSPYIILAIVISVIDPINRIYIAYLQIKRSIKEYAIFYNAYVFIRLALLTVAVFVYHSAELYFVAYLIAVGLCVPIALYRLSSNIKWNLKITYIKEALSYSIYIIPVTIASFVNGLIGRAFIMDKMDVASVGIYSAGFNVGQIIYLIAMVFNMAYVSFFIQKYEEVGDDICKSDSVRSMSDIMFFLVFFAAFMISILAPVFMPLLPKDYAGAVFLIPLFAFTGVANGLYFISTNYLSLKQKLVKYKLFGLLFGLAANVLISIWLIEDFGVMAAALANVISVYLSSCILLFINRKVGHFKYPAKIYWITPILLIVTYALFYFIYISPIGVRLIVITVGILLFYLIFDNYFFSQKRFILKNVTIIFNKYVKTIHR